MEVGDKVRVCTTLEDRQRRGYTGYLNYGETDFIVRKEKNWVALATDVTDPKEDFEYFSRWIAEREVCALALPIPPMPRTFLTIKDAPEKVLSTRHPHADVAIAWFNDTSLQVENRIEEDEPWMTVEHPQWHKNQQYRIKPNSITYLEGIVNKLKTELETAQCQLEEERRI